MPVDAKAPATTSTQNTDHTSEENNDATKEFEQEHQETPQLLQPSEAATFLDIAEQKSIDDANIIHKPGFFKSGSEKRKQMVPLTIEEENELTEDKEEHKPRARHTELRGEHLCGKQCNNHTINNTKLNAIPLLSRFSFNSAPKLICEKNLSPDFYQPFLQELFTVIANNEFEQFFILTGSAAKQLQNSEERNPNDIDLLLKNSDLMEGSAKLKKVLGQMQGISMVSDDLSGTFSIQYNGKLFKIQAIDSQTSRHCFPAKADENKYQYAGAILMLDASVIPQKEVFDIDEDFDSDIAFERIINF